MLPFNKRSRETQVSATALPRFPLTSYSVLAYRPQLESFSDDERTRVMTRSSTPPPLPSRREERSRRAPPPPPTPSQKAAAAARPIRVYPPKPSMDEPTKTAFNAPPPRTGMFYIPPPPLMPADMAVTSVVPPHPSSTSDLPPAVITSSTTISLGRPTPSWAAALVALGVFAGLVTAVLARGDGDALVHAGAQLVDPTHQAGAAQAFVAAPVFPQPTAVIVQPTITPTPMTPVAVKASCAEDKEAKDLKDVKDDEEAKPEPKVRAVAKSAPVVQAPVVKPPVVQQKVAAKTAPSPKADPVVAAPKPVSKAAKAADIDGASAADALAKAQLEAALGR